jgi:hypothetical protein
MFFVLPPDLLFARAWCRWVCVGFVASLLARSLACLRAWVRACSLARLLACLPAGLVPPQQTRTIYTYVCAVRDKVPPQQAAAIYTYLCAARV